jgi:hypothetical protein
MKRLLYLLFFGVTAVCTGESVIHGWSIIEQFSLWISYYKREYGQFPESLNILVEHTPSNAYSQPKVLLESYENLGWEIKYSKIDPTRYDIEIKKDSNIFMLRCIKYDNVDEYYFYRNRELYRKYLRNKKGEIISENNYSATEFIPIF